MANYVKFSLANEVRFTLTSSLGVIPCEYRPYLGIGMHVNSDTIGSGLFATHCTDAVTGEASYSTVCR